MRNSMAMKKHLLLNTVIAALAIPVSGFADNKKTQPNPSQQPPAKSGDVVKDPESARNQFSGPITSVNREEKSITVNDRELGAHRLLIADTTKLKRGDKDATWDDLKIGAKVEGVCRGGKEKAQAETITIHE
jgi:hypothetical protein